MVVFLLCLCGYITPKQLLLIYLVLIVGIILSAIKPAISSIYTVPSDRTGLKPAMILFKKISQENLGKVESSPDESEFNKLVETYKKASKIIADQFSDHPEMLEKYPEISAAFQMMNIGLEKVNDYWQFVEQERKKRNLKNGVPPINSTNCPPKYPIRATDHMKNAEFNGRYYFPDERRGLKEVYWCFASPQEAENDKFKRPDKKPPKQ
ncbi:hypothetical protein [Lyngbya aestuarii]|nr:hypothetical protein [Lyngbya aestuarii]